MEDNLNQDLTEETVEMPEDFFGDDTATEEFESNEVEEADTPAEEPEAEEEEETEEVEDTEEQPFLTIRYNKEDKNISRDEAIELSQKGMNYDKIHGEYTSLNDRLTKLSKKNDMSVDDYLKNLEEVQYQFELNKQVEALSSEYGDAPAELIQELAAARMEQNRTKEMSKEDEQVIARKNEIERQMNVFAQRYPNVDPSKLEQGVYALMKSGFTLLEAYESVEADRRMSETKKLESQAKIDRQNKLNRSKSLGNTSSTGQVDKDDFLSGFMSDD